MKIKSKTLKDTIVNASQQPTGSLLKTKVPKAKTKAKEDEPVEETKLLDVVLDDTGVLGTLEKTKSKEVHLRYVTYDGGKKCRLDIRQYNLGEKFSGYTGKGLTISEDNIEQFRHYINQIADLIQSGELEAVNIIIEK